MLVDARGVIGPRQFINGAHYKAVDTPRQPERYAQQGAVLLGGIAAEEALKEGNRERLANALEACSARIRAQRPDDSIEFRIADMEDLWLPNASVREVYACDVLSSQLTEESAGRILREVRRVLEDDGRLVTRECQTPLWFNEACLRAAAPQAGLRVTQTSYHGSPAYQDLATEFGHTVFDVSHHHAKDFMYFGILEPA